MDRERDRERDGAPREGLFEEFLHGYSLLTWELPRPTFLAARAPWTQPRRQWSRLGHAEVWRVQSKEMSMPNSGVP